jgi:hypothetical protein
MAAVKEDNVNSASGAVGRRRTRRGDKPGVFLVQFPVVEAGPAGSQPVKVRLPQALLNPDGTPALFELKLVSVWQARLGASEPGGDPRANVEEIVGQLLHVRPALVDR